MVTLATSALLGVPWDLQARPSAPASSLMMLCPLNRISRFRSRDLQTRAHRLPVPPAPRGTLPAWPAWGRSRSPSPLTPSSPPGSPGHASSKTSQGPSAPFIPASTSFLKPLLAVSWGSP